MTLSDPRFMPLGHLRDAGSAAFVDSALAYVDAGAACAGIAVLAPTPITVIATPQADHSRREIPFTFPPIFGNQSGYPSVGPPSNLTFLKYARG